MERAIVEIAAGVVEHPDQDLGADSYIGLDVGRVDLCDQLIGHGQYFQRIAIIKRGEAIGSGNSIIGVDGIVIVTFFTTTDDN
jgi:hypothetical protein